MDNDMGERLLEVRTESGLSQKLLASQLLGVGVKIGADMVGRYERGENSPTSDYTLGFCLFFNINPAWLLSGEGRRAWKPVAGARHDKTIVAQWLREQMNQIDDSIEDAASRN